MTESELQQKIEELQKQIDELKNTEIEEKQKKWKPEYGETYYCINADCCTNFYRFDNDEFDNNCVKLGNCFATKEEAQFVADKIKYTQKFRQYVEEHSETIDWENNGQEKWYIYYDFDNCCISYCDDDVWKIQGVIYASSQEILQDAIAYVGRENVKKYVLGVEE